ncbi:hypothetical protein CJ030_MR4G025306 [Morella rubra]|uniref:Late embryogenesis abundant protein LEA-2 subgroup domain-containing protein n=1 Tax=Morella rubra TaxID=262757 RepID=A0A6A1VR60_9ROSI|nr:hypothetical protein CJ030_MR4G025306 [Morella rubra]
MAERTNQQVYPLAPEKAHPRSDEESNAVSSDELRRKKRIKLATYIVAFAVFQVIVITAFALTVMKVKTPKVRLGTVALSNVNNNTQSFDISFTTQVTIKNTNFGPYKYDDTNVTFTYQGVTVGQASIPKSKAGLRSTKKVSVTVNVNSNVLPNTTSLVSELGAGVLTLSSHAKLSGKVELMFVMKKKKSAEMICTMSINLSTRAVQDLTCE